MASQPIELLTDSPRSTAVSSRQRVKLPILVLAAVLVSQVPLLYWHLASLLAKPHFQFVLLLPVGIAVLAWQRWQELPVISQGKTWLTTLLGAMAVGILSIATYFWSPWLASVAMMVTLLAALYGIGGWVLLKAMLPAWFLLGFFVGLPFDLDVDLIKFLREFATLWSSALLDEFGVRHLIGGNVIELPGRAFFIADACSGIHSLFVIGAAALFIGLWNRRPLHHVLTLLVCALALVIVENLTRLVGVVIADRVGLNLADGWPHKAFGGLVFVLTLLLLLSADQFISFILPKELLAWHRERAVAKVHTTKELRGGATRLPNSSGSYSYSYVALAACFVSMGGWQIVRAPSETPTLDQYSVANAFPELAKLTEGDMPERIGGFVRKSIRFEQRSLDDPKGSFSQIWIYEGGGNELEISVDYAYPTVRDLCQCYELTGWKVEQQRMVDGQKSDEAFVEAILSKPYRGNATLMFSFMNRAGDNGSRVFSRDEKTFMQRSMARLASLVRPTEKTQDEPFYEIVGPVLQIQLLAANDRELTEAEQAKTMQFFRVARNHLRQACLAKLRGAA